jgi:hypothetical protein
VTRSLFEKSRGPLKGGAFLEKNVIQLIFLTVRTNSARFGGGIHATRINHMFLNRVCFLANSAEYMGGAYLDGVEENERPTQDLVNLNFDSATRR